jgi:hypothetical protein
MTEEEFDELVEWDKHRKPTKYAEFSPWQLIRVGASKIWKGVELTAVVIDAVGKRMTPKLFTTILGGAILGAAGIFEIGVIAYFVSDISNAPPINNDHRTSSYSGSSYSSYEGGHAPKQAQRREQDRERAYETFRNHGFNERESETLGRAAEHLYNQDKQIRRERARRGL